jgi:hypothetical protein
VDPRVWIVGALLTLGFVAPLLARRRVSPLWMIVAALVFGVVTALVVRRSDDLTELTAQELLSAQEAWRGTGTDDYDLEVFVLADRLEDGRFEIEVRGGRVTRALQNGIATSGTADAYSVAGLFEILQRELELSTDASRGFGAPEGYRAYLRVRFNAQLGYPEVYRRSVGGTSNGVEIRVLRLSTL